MLQIGSNLLMLQFKSPAGTSRGVLTQKPSWIFSLTSTTNPSITGRGECSIIPGLSFDDVAGFDQKLADVLADINKSGIVNLDDLHNWPSIRFGLDTALRDFKNGGRYNIFPSDFTQGEKGIPINGLIWMGDKTQMAKQIDQKLKDGYSCLKLKIGAIHFQDELSLLKSIRQRYNEDILQLRVDANGAFDEQDVWNKLEQLSHFKIHSIEQPVKAGRWLLMKQICEKTPIPVALDEELIGIWDEQPIEEMLDYIKPQYIILKPGLLGGFDVCDTYIKVAHKKGIGWWVTSALESSIGLNAIAQYIFQFNPLFPQGLGTGQIYNNNIPSPLEVTTGRLYYNPRLSWA